MSYANEYCDINFDKKSPVPVERQPIEPISQGDHKIRKNPQIFQKIAQKVAKSKKAKISTTKLNLKAQIIYNKPLLKP